MTISAKEVKALRDRTGAGMMECKSALEEANGDIEAAIDILRAKGAAKAAKRAAREATAHKPRAQSDRTHGGCTYTNTRGRARSEHGAERGRLERHDARRSDLPD